MDLQKSKHWAVQAAQAAMRMHGEKEEYTCSAGITPSGVIHIGNFREVITVEMIYRAMLGLGKKARFIYSWDSFDAFRKVPKGVPNPKEMEQYLRLATVDVPDVFGCGHSSYTEHHIKNFEEQLPPVGISAQFIQQHEKYRNCDYAKEMDYCLQHTKDIVPILNKYRTEDLEEGWLPVVVFCDSCKKDTIEDLQYEGDHKLTYKCACGHNETFDLREKGIAKLKWRVDWPMRWHYENVDFEPAGKDHFVRGGSRDVGVEIQKALWDERAPHGFMYEWNGLKGGKQFASSTGNVLTVNDMLEVYEPVILRWLHSSTRPNAAFDYSFDEDVLSIYEQFDKCEQISFGVREAGEKEKEKQEAIYYFSCPNEVPEHCPIDVSFGNIVQMLQIFNYDESVTYAHYADGKELDSVDHERLSGRIRCAKNWLEKHAPENVKFRVRDEKNVAYYDALQGTRKDCIDALKTLLEEFSGGNEELVSAIFAIPKSREADMKTFFTDCYQMILGKEKGPKLGGFIETVGVKRIAEIL